MGLERIQDIQGAFLLSGLASRTSQLANEIGFFHMVFAEKTISFVHII